MKVNSFFIGAAMTALAAGVPAFAADNYVLDELQVDSGLSTEYRASAAGGASADTRGQRATLESREVLEQFHPALEQLQSDSGVSTEYRPAQGRR